MFTRRTYLDSFLRSLRGVGDYCISENELARSVTLTIRRIADRELTRCQRQALDLCFFGGKTVTDAAKMLGKNKSTVSRHLTAARTRIEQALKYTGLTRL